MGLDMFLFRFTRLDDDDLKIIIDKNFDVSKYPKYTELELSNPNGEREGVEDVMPYLHVIEKPCEFYDHNKLKEYFNVPLNATLEGSSECCYCYEWFFALGKKKYVVSSKNIPQKDYNKVIVTYPIKYGYCKRDDVAYWRKAYELDKRLCSAYDGEVVNCGYHKLNNEMRRIILEHEAGSLAAHDIEDAEDSIVCYQQWY